MHRATLLVLAVVLIASLADGQYYVPRAYYIIDAEGHASAPVPLRRLRRHLMPIPYSHSSASSSADATAEAISHGGDSSVSSHARAESGSGDWAPGAGWMKPLGYFGFGAHPY